LFGEGDVRPGASGGRESVSLSMARTVPAVMLRRTDAAGLVASAVAAADGFCTAEPRDDPFAKAPLVHVLYVLAQSRSRLTGLSFFCKLFEQGKNEEALVPSL